MGRALCYNLPDQGFEPNHVIYVWGIFPCEISPSSICHGYEWCRGLKKTSPHSLTHSLTDIVQCHVYYLVKKAVYILAVFVTVSLAAITDLFIQD